MKLIKEQCYTLQRKELIHPKIKRLKTYQILRILIVNLLAVEEVHILTYTDSSSLAPKKQLSMPKPQSSNIFKS